MLAVPGSVRQGCGRSQLRGWGEQSGAAEACWAYKPEVDASKPSSANGFFPSSSSSSHCLSLASFSECSVRCCAPALCAPMAMALLLPQPLLSATATFLLLCLLTSQHSQRDPHQGRPVGLQRQPDLPPQGTGGPGDTSVSPFPSGSSIPTSQPQAGTSRNLQVGRRTRLVLLWETPMRSS